MKATAPITHISFYRAQKAAQTQPKQPTPPTGAAMSLDKQRRAA